MQRVVLFAPAVVLAIACSRPIISDPPHPSLVGLPQEYRDLHMQQHMFMRAWYWHMDEASFWKFISRGGPLERSDDRSLFYDAFSKPMDQVNIGSRQLSSDVLVYSLGEPGDIIDYTHLNPGNESFAMIAIDLSAALEVDDFHVHSEFEERFWSTLPEQPYTTVMYSIEGEGYTSSLITVLWIREDDSWKIWSILPYQ